MGGRVRIRGRIDQRGLHGCVSCGVSGRVSLHLFGDTPVPASFQARTWIFHHPSHHGVLDDPHKISLS